MRYQAKSKEIQSKSDANTPREESVRYQIKAKEDQSIGTNATHKKTVKYQVKSRESDGKGINVSQKPQKKIYVMRKDSSESHNPKVGIFFFSVFTTCDFVLLYNSNVLLYQ